jgi:DNA-binding transcriptional ArsR family regulator
MFKTLSSETRRKILKILIQREMHVSGLARELGISVPVAAKHCKLLEEKGLIERKTFGKTHILRARLDKLYEGLNELSESHEVEVEEGANILDALKQVSGVRIEKIGEREFVTSIDGEAGYYIYEVNGSFPDVPMDRFVLKGNVHVELKKLVPVKRKEMRIRLKKGED